MTQTQSANREAALPKLPADSGYGRRIVFDQSEQRVWLVAADGDVKRSYLVTGSNRGNLRPGFYAVKSRTRYARTYRGGGTLEYFVKFTQGRTAAIGFHAVTMTRGGLVYARSDLGTPHTPGCVEAWRNDAKALWAFAPLGTKVVVRA
ncbi:MAG TPA: L,D-transpeptidase [Aeromicrobium sp.]|nr:L,D-transpeptidase [Aeromicrobium sp.]